MGHVERYCIILLYHIYVPGLSVDSKCLFRWLIQYYTIPIAEELSVKGVGMWWPPAKDIIIINYLIKVKMTIFYK